MKTRLAYSALFALLFTVGSANLAWAQFARATGKVTDKDQPLANVQVILKSPDTGREVKAKTGKDGTFIAIGIPVGRYNLSVIDSSKKVLITQDGVTIGVGSDNDENKCTIDITNGISCISPGGASVGNAGMSGRTQEFAGDATNPQAVKTGKTSSGPAVSKEELEAIKASRAKAENINGMIKQYQDAKAAKDWKSAITALQGMTAADPTHWEYFSELGNMQYNDGQYAESVQSYDQGIKVADGYVTGATPKDPKNANSDPAKAKSGEATMLTMQGSAYVKLNKNTEAVAAYTKAASMDPNPGIAYFNLCATQYNTGNTEGALAACDKAIAADPNKADAYFIKGSLLMAGGSEKDGKFTAPPGTAEALNKYLELAPDGGHAADVKQMLAYIGSKVESTYKSTKKK